MRRYAAPPLRPPRICLGQIPKGYLGSKRTAQHMKALIRAGAKDFYVRQKAIDILLEKDVRPKDYLGEIKALFGWVQQNVRYTKDPFRVELLHSARRMLELRAGDCDDMAILLGAMVEAIGHPVRLVLTGPDPLQPHLFTHVYLDVHHKGRWIPLDPTVPHPMGWAPHTSVREVIPIGRSPNMLAEDAGVGGAIGAAPVSDWLPGLVTAIRGEGLQSQDARLRSLSDLLRQRQLLSRSPRLRALLRRVWSTGLPVRERPRTTRRLIRVLRRRGIPPSRPVREAAPQPIGAPFGPIRTGPGRPGALRPVRPVRVRPLARVAGRG